MMIQLSRKNKSLIFNISKTYHRYSFTTLDKAKLLILNLKNNNNTKINNKVDIYDYNNIGMGLGLRTNYDIEKGNL